MVLSTEWSQVEVIDLVNDGNGLGFILVGGRSTGVVIKALTPGGVAERDGRLQCGDHLLQLGEVNLRGFSSEQVATVLRQCGAEVRLIVARPVEPSANDYQCMPSQAPIIPTKLLSDPEELLRTLCQNASFAITGTFLGIEPDKLVDNVDFLPVPDTELADLPLPPLPLDVIRPCPKNLDIIPFSLISPPPKSLSNNKSLALSATHTPIETVIVDHKVNQVSPVSQKELDNNSDYLDSPETETYVVELHKNVYGLGITVAGYVCEEEDLSGIFVKSIIEGSAAEMSGCIQINDRIVAVDGKSLAGVSNHQAVEILRNTDIVVHLTLERFLRGRKYEHLQNALTELKTETQSQASLPPSPSIATLSWLPPKSDADSIGTEVGGAVIMLDFGDLTSRDTVESNMSNLLDPTEQEDGKLQKPTEIKSPLTNGNISTSLLDNLNHTKSTTPVNLTPNGDVTSTFSVIQDNDRLIVTETQTENKNHMPKAKPSPPPPPPSTPLATTTTTTKPPENIVPVPVVKSPSSDSLKRVWKSEFPESEIYVAEINKLSGLGISLEGTVDVECGIEKRPHHYIRSILDDGPVGRQGILKPGDELLQVNEHKLQGLKHTEVVKILKELPKQVKLVCARGNTAPTVINTSQNPEAFETRSLLPGGHQSLQNLLTKALSESSLYTSSTATLTDQQRSKSLENVSGLALWSSDVTTIEIEKTEQGFGFSILDYQDPLDSEGSVIVIRGLIRGGAAEATNEIFPGDRLISVGDKSLQGLELDEAVTILKGMPVGKHKLGICRPLSSSDSNIASPAEGEDTPST